MGTPITVNPDELAFLRGVLGLGPSDASLDSEILGRSTYGAGRVPTDPGFYTDLVQLAHGLGIDPLWVLVVIASESNFATDRIAPAGTFRDSQNRDVTPRGLIGFTSASIPSVMSWQEWDALPAMSARQQLPYVFKVLSQNMQRLGRPYSKAAELYMSVAAPNVLSPTKQYDPNATLYSGSSWAGNLVLDSWPYNWQWQAMKRGELPVASANPVLYAQNLAKQGLLHGKVTLGDLQQYLDRMRGQDPTAASWAGGGAKRWLLAWNLAYRRLLSATGGLGSQTGPFTFASFSPAQPGFDFDSTLPSPGDAPMTQGPGATSSGGASEIASVFGRGQPPSNRVIFGAIGALVLVVGIAVVGFRADLGSLK